MGCRVINLTFHGIGTPGRPIPPGEDQVWVTAGSFHEMLDRMSGKQDVMITFDDGNASDVELAMPALLAHRLKGAFFVLAGRLGEAGSLSAGDLRELRRAGMMVGLHGMDHVPWRTLNERQLTVELVDARRKIEDALGERVGWAACPFGSYGRRVLRRLRDEGFEHVYTSDRGPAFGDAWLQPRNTVGSSDRADGVELLCRQRRSPLVRQVAMAVKRYR